jgi:hypothetical protein
MTRPFSAPLRESQLSTIDATTLLDKLLLSVQRAKHTTNAVLSSQQRQLDAASIQLV